MTETTTTAMMEDLKAKVQARVDKFNQLPFIVQNRAFHTLDQNKESEKKLETIREKYHPRNGRIVDITDINDAYQIVEVEDWRKGTTWYDVWVEYQNIHMAATTFDMALQVAIIVKNIGKGSDSQAAIWAVTKLLGMEW